ncbi:unnamed protein product [Acanthoscelides obtectus]|uniref:Uncharacterized protein n=1 Tax=Acanthoscelides obtectus TaxID=200917 RepID=A0A9P0Q0U2_ACAOB|nr:unnamed protein product [Acanthoscelides obtectus]CAK1672187.1 hypothetical protein AOBTE_LOCUS28704 [Acanthoscelides obtectus]
MQNIKDSDDSIKDKDYEPRFSDESSVDSNHNLQSTERTERASNNNIAAAPEYRGRPKKEGSSSTRNKTERCGKNLKIVINSIIHLKEN